MLIGELTRRQIEELKRLLPTYSHSGYLSTEGNEYLLLALLDLEVNKEKTVFEVMHREFNFYRDVTPQLLGEVMMILLLDDTTEPIL